MKNVRTIATLVDGRRVRGVITTSHSDKYYGRAVFADDNHNVIDWLEIDSIMTVEMQVKGGARSTPAKRKAARENGKKGGRPKKEVKK